jgi:pimeloyl-ACP methyl ester carboxylesterase
MPFIKTNGIRMYYEERGAGEPLVLIMGITAPGSVWEKHADCWSQKFRCLMPDNRGVGHSSKPAGPYTSALMADDYAGLMDRLGLKQARVVGCSMGSVIAQQLALRHPKKVRSLVLMCPWARCDAYARGLFDHIVAVNKNETPTEFVRFLQLLIYSKGSWDDKRWQREFRAARQMAEDDPRPQPFAALKAQAAACTSHDAYAQLQRIKCPALVIGGATDIFTPPWMAREVASQIPKCDLHLYPNAGHVFHWERLADFNPRVLKWLLAH